VLDPQVDVPFPESVVQLFRGDLGQPYGGFPEGLLRKVLKGATPLTRRPGAEMPAVDLAAERARIQQRVPHPITDDDLAAIGTLDRNERTGPDPDTFNVA